ncbi:MAG: MBL fold metallo-hydrolase [Nitriliruptorales bacterium]|nr:MBL fold metallo-hydrolase [Nitriliruptorales bacterium]
MDIVPIVDEGLGNSAYVVGLGEGLAAVVDPSRDPSRYQRAAEPRGWRLAFSVETHLHADFVSGSRELAALGAQVIAPADAGLAFPARGLHDGDEIDLGGLTLRALATPGHTPEHLAYLLADGARPLGVFTGGTLITGGVARPDLLGPEQTEPLARAAYRSLHERLLTLPDDLPVWPTHGAGSFCSAGGDGGRTSTIGNERRANPLLRAPDEDTFVAHLLTGLGSHPPYFLELRTVNRGGPRVYGGQPPVPTRVDVPAFRRALDGGAELIDVRPIADFAAGHLPGSLSIALRDQFATWLGWLVDRARPFVVVASRDTDRALLVRECLKIGYERLLGELDGGVAAWGAAGLPLQQIPLVEPGDALTDRPVLDVRQRAEWSGGHLPDAVHVELGMLARDTAAAPNAPVTVHCGHGARAMTGASLLARAGREDLSVLHGSPAELATARGQELEPEA